MVSLKFIVNLNPGPEPRRLVPEDLYPIRRSNDLSESTNLGWLLYCVGSHLLRFCFFAFNVYLHHRDFGDSDPVKSMTCAFGTGWADFLLGCKKLGLSADESDTFSGSAPLEVALQGCNPNFEWLNSFIGQVTNYYFLLFHFITNNLFYYYCLFVDWCRRPERWEGVARWVKIINLFDTCGPVVESFLFHVWWRFGNA